MNLVQLVGVAALGGAVYYYRKPLQTKLFETSVKCWGFIRETEDLIKQMSKTLNGNQTIKPVCLWEIMEDGEVRAIPINHSLRLPTNKKSQYQLEYRYDNTKESYRVVFSDSDDLKNRWDLTGAWLDHSCNYDYLEMETNIPTEKYAEEYLCYILSMYAGPNQNFGYETTFPVTGDQLFDFIKMRPVLGPDEWIRLTDPILEHSITFSTEN